VSGSVDPSTLCIRSTTLTSADITATQQGILRDVYDTDDLSTIPQMWCMYKEVAEYFINGVSASHNEATCFTGAPSIDPYLYSCLCECECEFQYQYQYQCQCQCQC
jgi:hypothetical protein